MNFTGKEQLFDGAHNVIQLKGGAKDKKKGLLRARRRVCYRQKAAHCEARLSRDFNKEKKRKFNNK